MKIMINILFSGNDKVWDGIATCMLSILKRTATKEPFSFFVMTMDASRIKPEYRPIHDEMIQKLADIAKTYHTDNRVVKIDVTRLYEEEFANCPNEQCYCSPYTLLRLFADRIEEIPDKILYLDVDTMFQRDVCLLYDIDISGFEYAAANDHYGKYLISPGYINAGVLLLNMKKIRETGLLNKARNLICTKKLIFADQSAIIRSTTSRKLLPQRFNDQKFLHKHTIVRHFSKRLFYLPYPHTANIKQWNIEEIHRVFRYHQFDDILEEYTKWKETKRERDIS